MNGPIRLSSIAGDKDVFRFRWSTISQAEGRGSNPALLSTCPQQYPAVANRQPLISRPLRPCREASFSIMQTPTEVYRRSATTHVP